MKPRPTAHRAPRDGSDHTPCCKKTPTALPIGDRIVFDDTKVTCGKGEK